MQLESIRRIYDGQAPFATVYLEGRSPSEDAGHQLQLRWEDLRRRLSDQGAAEGVLDSIGETVLAEQPGEVQSTGRVVVADATGVLLDEMWDAALGAGDEAHLAEEPELGAYVREKERAARLLVAVADQHGAVVRRVVVSESHTVDKRSEKEIRDESDTVHKPREGALSHKQIQRRADEVVKQNVREVADHLGRAAEAWKPDRVVLAGEVQGRTALRDELPAALQDAYAEAEAGGVSDEGAEEALAEELRRLAADISDDRARQRAEQFESARARGLAVEGAEAVAQAAEMGAVETLLLEYDATGRREAALLGACVRTDAEAALIDAALSDSVGAVLRFEVPQQSR